MDQCRVTLEMSPNVLCLMATFPQSTFSYQGSIKPYFITISVVFEPSST